MKKSVVLFFVLSFSILVAKNSKAQTYSNSITITSQVEAFTFCEGIPDFLKGTITLHDLSHTDKNGNEIWTKSQYHGELISLVNNEVFRISGDNQFSLRKDKEIYSSTILLIGSKGTKYKMFLKYQESAEEKPEVLKYKLYCM